MRFVTTDGATCSSRATLEKLPSRATRRNAPRFSRLLTLVPPAQHVIGMGRSSEFTKADRALYGVLSSLRRWYLFPPRNGGQSLMIPLNGLKCPRGIRTWLLAGFVSTAVVPVALAQQAPAATDQSTDKLEEVVVSAQRRTENLQTTPIAITAITAASLEARNLDNISDVGAYVPNAVIAPLGAGWGSTMAAFI